MINQEIIYILKEQYTREIRKQLVKTILKNEKSNDKSSIESSYLLINQIFSYVLSELNWNLPNNSTNWDNTPLTIMCDVFPKLDTTKWYKEQLIDVKHSIKIKANIDEQ